MATTRKRTTGGARTSDQAPRKKRSKAPEKPGAGVRKARRPRREEGALALDSATLFAPSPPPVEVAPATFVQEEDIVADAVAPPDRSGREQLMYVPSWTFAPGRRGLSRWVWAAAPVLLLVGAVAFQLGAARGRRSGMLAAGSVAPLVAPALQPTAAPPPAAVAPKSPEPVEERALGHAAFAAGRQLTALRHYDRALRIDRGALDPQMIENLIACYGVRRTQPEAATLIVRFQIGDAKGALEVLRRDGRTRGTRAGARYTLEKLGHSNRDFVVRASERSAG